MVKQAALSGVWVVLAWISSPAHAATPSVSVVAGDVFYTDAVGQQHQITDKHLDSQPTLSPDGTKIAFIRTVRRATEEGEGDQTALYLFDIGRGSEVRAVAPHTGITPKEEFMTLGLPTFSLDGGYVYVVASAWATSGAIHQVNLTKRSERFVVGGNSDLVIRSGPWRGYLLVSRHRYWPKGGSYNPSYVVRPDGHEMFIVPGTQADDGVDHVSGWLGQNGWGAW